MKNVKKLDLEGDWAELGLKTRLLRQFRTKYLEQKKNNLIKLDRRRKVSCLFLRDL